MLTENKKNLSNKILNEKTFHLGENYVAKGIINSDKSGEGTIIFTKNQESIVSKGKWNKELKLEGFGSFEKSKDNITLSKYEGEFKNGLAHGSGTYVDNKIKYVGYFEKGDVYGDGTLTKNNGTIIIADFKNINSGYGQIKYPDSNIYQGNFDNLEPNGNGTLTDIQGNVYNGEFLNGEPNGNGTLTMNNYTYKGEFKNGLKNGDGVIEFSNGIIYKGKFANGQIEGRGILTEDNISYEGEFKNGNPVGQIIETNLTTKEKQEYFYGRNGDRLRNIYTNIISPMTEKTIAFQSKGNSI